MLKISQHFSLHIVVVAEVPHYHILHFEEVSHFDPHYEILRFEEVPCFDQIIRLNRFFDKIIGIEDENHIKKCSLKNFV